MVWEGYRSRLCKCNNFNENGLFGREQALCLSGDLKRRKAQGSQTTIQQSLIDINVVYQQLLKNAPKIG